MMCAECARVRARHRSVDGHPFGGRTIRARSDERARQRDAEIDEKNWRDDRCACGFFWTFWDVMPEYTSLPMRHDGVVSSRAKRGIWTNWAGLTWISPALRAIGTADASRAAPEKPQRIAEFCSCAAAPPARRVSMPFPVRKASDEAFGKVHPLNHAKTQKRKCLHRSSVSSKAGRYPDFFPPR